MFKNYTAEILKTENQFVESGFVVIPKNVVTDEEIHPKSKAIYMILATYRLKNNICLQNIENIAAVLNLSKNTVIKYLKELESNNFISVQKLRIKKITTITNKNIYTLSNFDKKINDGFGIFPRAVLKNNKLSADAKALYGFLSVTAGNDGYCYPNMTKICKKLNANHEIVRKTLKELISNNLVKVKKNRVKGQFANNVYILTSFEKIVKHKTLPTANKKNYEFKPRKIISIKKSANFCDVARVFQPTVHGILNRNNNSINYLYLASNKLKVNTKLNNNYKNHIICKNQLDCTKNNKNINNFIFNHENTNKTINYTLMSEKNKHISTKNIDETIKYQQFTEKIEKISGKDALITQKLKESMHSLQEKLEKRWAKEEFDKKLEISEQKADNDHKHEKNSDIVRKVEEKFKSKNGNNLSKCSKHEEKTTINSDWEEEFENFCKKNYPDKYCDKSKKIIEHDRKLEEKIDANQDWEKEFKHENGGNLTQFGIFYPGEYCDYDNDFNDSCDKFFENSGQKSVSTKINRWEQDANNPNFANHKIFGNHNKISPSREFKLLRKAGENTYGRHKNVFLTTA
ncbi:MAG: helix-turn-helix domain-containing protein [Prevotellaceae bacterium]|jgi:Mn-dependent DtxR family transcriptional regulator|nr:helix-turn-helix domain-containing protein [Prevotellaceae bacterium]